MKKYPRNKLGIRILDDPKQKHHVSKPDWDCKKHGHHGHHGPLTGIKSVEEDDFVTSGYYIFQRRCVYCGNIFWTRDG